MKWNVLALVATILPWTCGAEAPCGGAVGQLRVPAAWVHTARDGIDTWRSPTAHEALTIATYALSAPLDAKRRAALARKSVELERDAERRWGGARLSLAAVEQIQAGTVLQLCHTGFDPDARRSFASVTRVAGSVLQHAYYESVGLERDRFVRAASAVFAAQARNSQRYAAGPSTGATSNPLLAPISNAVPAGYTTQPPPAMFALSAPLTTVMRSGAFVPK
jgi:hypothetical protein